MTKTRSKLKETKEETEELGSSSSSSSSQGSEVDNNSNGSCCSADSWSDDDIDDDIDLVDDEDIPVREKRIWLVTEQQRRTYRRMQRLEADTRQRRLDNRHTHKKRTNFGWMKTVGKYPVSWGKKWKPAN